MRELAECQRCGALYRKREATHRFCSLRCSRLFIYHGPIMSDSLHDLATRCAKFIMACGDKRGVTPAELARFIGDDYRNLADDERFRVNVLICKVPGIAFAAVHDEFRFWPRAVAPEEAVRA